MSKLCFTLLLLILLVNCCQIVNSQQINQWKGTWLSDYVQTSPKYYSATGLKCSNVKFMLRVSSNSVNVALKKNSIPTFNDFDYRALSVDNSISYTYSGFNQEKDTIYVIINGAVSAWNLYALNFECV